MITHGSLFSGYEGFGLGLSAAGIEHRTLWVCDNDPAAGSILEARLPGVPNLGDITKVDWRAIAVPDLLTGGFPCTDVSLAGLGLGITDSTRSGLWLVMANAISVLRPRWVLIENVRGLLSARADSDVEPCPWCLGDRGGPDQEPVLRALGAVLGDLSDLGYDTRWVTVAACDVGAAHRRERVFLVAFRPGDDPAQTLRLPPDGHDRSAGTDPVLTSLVPTPGARLGKQTSITPAAAERRLTEQGKHNLDDWAALLPTPRASARENRQNKRSPSQEAGRHGLSLAAEVCELLPTPAASRGGYQRSQSPGAAVRPGLDMIDALLPTPRATDGTHGGPNQRGSSGELALPSAVQLLPTPDATHGRKTTRTGPLLPGAVELLPTPTASHDGRNATANRRDPKPTTQTNGWTLNDVAYADRWGRYADAIAQWETVIGRPAPDPVEPNPRGTSAVRLAAPFVEWLMGLPQGWVTGLVGRNQALQALGNGIVPQQCAHALRQLLATPP